LTGLSEAQRRQAPAARPPLRTLRHSLRTWLRPSPRAADTARAFAGLLPLRRLESLAGDLPWWHRDGHIEAGPLALVGWLGSPMRLEVGVHQGHWLLLQHQGISTIEQRGRQHELRAGAGLILPGEPWVLISRGAMTSGSLLPIDAAELLRKACWIHAERGAAATFQARPMGWPQPVGGCRDRRGASLLAALERSLASLCQLEQNSEGLLDPLLFHQQFWRLLALLAFPELNAVETAGAATRKAFPRSPGENGSGANGPAAHGPAAHDVRFHGHDALIEPLLAYIQANLDQPLNLQLLERRSHYSRRTLHNVFQQRFQCSPMQWIRQLRLARAFARLSTPGDGDTVQAVARACGYRSTSQFSADFQRFHGQRPSELLRLARAGALSAPPPAAAERSGPAPG
jgi:AraC-like DNA-binding protein